MGLPSGGAAVSALTSQQMIGVQCPELPNGSSANASTSWRFVLSREQLSWIQQLFVLPNTIGWSYSKFFCRYANGSAGFPNSFMDAFSSGMPPAPSGSQFSLSNQLYYQQYHPYLMPMMRNDWWRSTAQKLPFRRSFCGPLHDIFSCPSLLLILRTAACNIGFLWYLHFSVHTAQHGNKQMEESFEQLIPQTRI